MPSFDDIVEAPLGKLKAAADDWSEMAARLEKLADQALYGMKAKAYKANEGHAGRRERDEGERGVGVSLTAELHKETDPRPEFEASSTLTEIDGSVVERVERVPDLGDQAYLLTLEAGGLRLNVVEGGGRRPARADRLDVHLEDDSDDENGPPDYMAEPDVLAYRAELINDMREVMKALKAG
ncbi:hypothetical protein SCALM49S_06355 [Streptomyces californicus]